MNNRLINLKPISQIMAELSAPLGNVVKDRDYDGVPYIPVEAIRERLDAVLGREHYNEAYETISVEQARSTIAIMVKARIEVLDDNFEPCFFKEAGGGKTIMFPKETPDVINEFPNAVASACQDAFKRVCTQKFGIGLSELNAGKAAKKGQTMLIAFKQNVSYTSDRGFFAPVTANGVESKIAVFRNSFSTFSAGIPAGTAAGTAYNMIVKPGKDKQGNDQLVFVAFA